jgi:hypothetical protein
MSRGPGYIQRAIRELIEANPDGAWQTSALCRLVYRPSRQPTKAQRVAISRALRRMTLPGTWDTVGRFGDREYWLCDPCNLKSMKIVYWKAWLDRSAFEKRFEPGGDYFKQVEKAKRWRDASPLERINVEIEDLQSRVVMAKRFGGATPEFLRGCGEQMRQLQEEKTALAQNVELGADLSELRE